MIEAIALADPPPRRLEPPFADELVDVWWNIPCRFDAWAELRTTGIAIVGGEGFRIEPKGFQASILPVNLRWDEETGEPTCDDLVAFAPVGNRFWLWEGTGRWLDPLGRLGWCAIDETAGPLVIAESIPDWLGRVHALKDQPSHDPRWPVFPLCDDALHDLYDMVCPVEVVDGGMGLNIRDYLRRPAGRIPQIIVGV